MTSGPARSQYVAADSGSMPSAQADIAAASKIAPASAPPPAPPRATWDLDGDRVACPYRDRTDFGDLLETRRSATTGGSVSVGDVGALLARSYRVQSFSQDDDGYQRSWRPVPSAGGRHPFELLVCAEDVSGLPRGWWWFDAGNCDLVSLTLRTSMSTYLQRLMARTPAIEMPAVAVVCVAVAERTLSRYPTGMSLVWRDAGALQFALQMVAHDLGVASRIVASSSLLSEPSWGNLTFDAGALVVWGRP